jgi:hypothetical protein
LNGAYLSSIVLPCVVSTSAPTQEVMTVDCGGGGGGGGGGGRQTPGKLHLQVYKKSKVKQTPNPPPATTSQLQLHE